MINSCLQHYFFNGIKVIFTRPRRVLQVIKNFFYDIKYSRSYMGIPVNNENKIAGFTCTTSTEYYILEDLFSKIDIKNTDVIVDVGCGRGRVLAWLMRKGIKNKIIGIEVDPAVADKTRKSMSRYINVSVLTGDVAANDFMIEGNIFYLFNPFNENVLKKFISKIEENILKEKQNKNIVFVYYNCKHLYVFDDNPLWSINRLGDFDGLPAAIITAR